MEFWKLTMASHLGWKDCKVTAYSGLTNSCYVAWTDRHRHVSLPAVAPIHQNWTKAKDCRGSFIPSLNATLNFDSWDLKLCLKMYVRDTFAIRHFDVYSRPVKEKCILWSYTQWVKSLIPREWSLQPRGHLGFTYLKTTHRYLRS